MRAALIAALAALIALPVQAQVSRLPRDQFDVIPPESRIAGERGDLKMIQPLCRVGPTHWARRRVVDIAVQEWAMFGYQTADARVVETRRLPDEVVAQAVNPLRPEPRSARIFLRLGGWEDEPRFDKVIAGYWSATADGPAIIERQNRLWNSTDHDVSWVEPWSAAFVSWVMCEAGLGEMAQFERHVGHRVYIDQAIRARDGQAPEAAFVAYDAGEAQIAPGDLLCNARGGVNYRSLADRRPEMGEHAPAHCDIVVRVAEDRINVIGGNVVDGMTLTILPLTQDGGAYPRPTPGVGRRLRPE